MNRLNRRKDQIYFGILDPSIQLFCNYVPLQPSHKHLHSLAAFCGIQYCWHCLGLIVQKHCTLYTLHCTRYTVEYTRCTVNNVHFVQLTLYTVHGTLYTVECILCTITTVHYIFYTVVQKVCSALEPRLLVISIAHCRVHTGEHLTVLCTLYSIVYILQYSANYIVDCTLNTVHSIELQRAQCKKGSADISVCKYPGAKREAIHLDPARTCIWHCSDSVQHAQHLLHSAH